MAFERLRENVMKLIAPFTRAKRTAASKTALLIVHPQSDACQIGASYAATPETHAVCRNIGRLAPHFRKAAIPIYAVQAVELGNASPFFGYDPKNDNIFAVISKKDRLNNLTEENFNPIFEKLKKDNRTDELLICGVSLMRDVLDIANKAKASGIFSKVTILNDLTANDARDDDDRKKNNRNITEVAALSGVGFKTSNAVLHPARRR